jgi:hypothetical protein
MIYLGSLGIVLPPTLGSDLPLYIEVGRVHGGLGEFSLWYTCAGVQEGLATASCGLWQYHGAEEALASPDCSVLTR